MHFFLGLAAVVAAFAQQLPDDSITYISTPVAYASMVVTVPVSPLSTSTIAALVRDTQHKYHLKDSFYKTLECESAGFQNIQSQVVVPAGPNGQEDSWGIPQIHLPDHPEISREQALTVPFAVDWAGQQFAAGRQKMFSCYRMLYGRM